MRLTSGPTGAVTLAAHGAALVARAPVDVLVLAGGEQHRQVTVYDTVEPVPDGLRGVARLTVGGVDVHVEDTWTAADGHADLSRHVQATVSDGAPGAGTGQNPAAAIQVRLRLETPTEPARYLAPGMAYSPDQWADVPVHQYADHRLGYPVVAAHLPESGVVLWLARTTVADHDEAPLRSRGESVYVQRTDVGSVGFDTGAGGGVGSPALLASWPYAEVDRSSTLDSTGTPAVALYPVPPAGLAVTLAYRVAVEPAAGYAGAVRAVTGRVVEIARPTPTPLPVGLAESVDLRLGSAARTYVEYPDGFAGFRLSFDPDHGYEVQARAFGASFADHGMGGSWDLLEYGFTGRQLNVASRLAERDPRGWGGRADRVADSFVTRMTTPSGWVHTVWDGAAGVPRFTVGDPGGPVMHYLGTSDVPGTYTRMMAEAGSDLAEHVVRRTATHGPDDERVRRWRAALLALADFFVRVQQPDGSWYRVYAPDGTPVTDGAWFGGTGVPGRSATGTVVPFLLDVADLMAHPGADRGASDPAAYRAAARRAGDFVLREHVAHDDYRGGTLDNPNVVDKEAAFIAMRALYRLHRWSPDPALLDGARRAATLAVTWHSLWPVPLVPGTRLAQARACSVGWGGINPVWGVGVTDIYSLFFLEDLHRLGVELGEELFVVVARLVAHSSLQVLAVPGELHGFADVGMQPEGIAFCSQGTDDGLITKGDTWGGLAWPYTAGTDALARWSRAVAETAGH